MMMGQAKKKTKRRRMLRDNYWREWWAGFSFFEALVWWFVSAEASSGAFVRSISARQTRACRDIRTALSDRVRSRLLHLYSNYPPSNEKGFAKADERREIDLLLVCWSLQRNQLRLGSLDICEGDWWAEVRTESSWTGKTWPAWLWTPLSNLMTPPTTSRLPARAPANHLVNGINHV